MKICYTNFHHGDGGGHTTYILNLVRALVRRHEISVVAPGDSRLYEEAGQLSGVRVHALNFRSGLSSLLGLRALLRRERHDTVHVNGPPDHRCAMLASIGLGRQRPRIILTKHNTTAGDSMGNTLRAWLATDRVICVSGDTRDRMARSAYQRCGLHVVRNGVDVSRYAPWSAEPARQARRHWLGENLPSDALVVGSNAGTASYKNWLDMVRAAASLPDPLRRRIYILLAGQPFSDADHAEIASLGMAGRVIHAGLLQDVRPFIAALDMGFVLTYRETISFACREMMSMGKPVVVADAGGLPENVDPNQNGWIVPPHTPAVVAAVLRAALDHPDRLAAMGRAARAKSVAEFGLERFVQETEQIYQSSAGGGLTSTRWRAGCPAIEGAPAFARIAHALTD